MATTEELLTQALKQERLKQGIYPARERALALTNVEQGLLWLQELERRERHAEFAEEPRHDG